MSFSIYGDISRPKEKYGAIHSDRFILQRAFGTASERARRNLNAKFSNPLAGCSHTELRQQERTFTESYDMGDESDIRAFVLGAILA
jgi:hypothetical protein